MWEVRILGPTCDSLCKVSTALKGQKHGGLAAFSAANPGHSIYPKRELRYAATFF